MPPRQAKSKSGNAAPVVNTVPDALAILGSGGGGGSSGGAIHEDVSKELEILYGMVDALGLNGGDSPASILSKLPAVLCPQEAGPQEGDEAGPRAGPEELMAKLDAAIERGCRLANALVLGGGESIQDIQDIQDMNEVKAKVQFVVGSMYYLNQALRASTIAWRMISAGPSAITTPTDAELVAGIARFAKTDPEEANRMQQLLLYLLNMAQVRGYRRRHGEMYRRISAPKAVHDTHAWERVCDMQEFVYETTRKELNYDMWLNLTCARVNVNGAVDHLKSCRDVQLPDLHKDRHVFSFSNGIYLAMEDRFCEYGSPEHAELPNDLVAAKYFPMEFERAKYVVEDGQDWYDVIKTPRLQSILDYQDMTPEVARWMYVMIGRILYEVNELDGWQVLPFLKGAASSGKSTILTRVCRGFYEAQDVGTLSNNIERKFGLSALHDKLVFIGPEIKSDIALEQVGGGSAPFPPGEGDSPSARPF